MQLRQSLISDKVVVARLKTQDSVALIIALQVEDGHGPNLLVPLSNHLILKDHWPNLLGFNDYSAESTRSLR